LYVKERECEVVDWIKVPQNKVLAGASWQSEYLSTLQERPYALVH